MALRSQAIQKWWPTTQSLDLVEGAVEVVAGAVEAEVRRFVGGEAVVASWESFASLDAAIGRASEFANVPTFYLVLPSRSRWTVLWNNSFLCDGYDSLCWCLASRHRLTTLHWSAHDETTTFQPGAMFCHRSWVAEALAERFVQVAREDARWLFRQKGTPIPEEDLDSYQARRKRDRLNEAALSGLLARLGAAPWDESFYALPERRVFVIERRQAPATVKRRSRAEVIGARMG